MIEKTTTTEPSQPEQSMNKTKNEKEWCFAWFADNPIVQPGAEKAVLLKNTQWPQGSIITISFLDGNPAVQERVKQAAQLWITKGGANLTFDFRSNTNKTDIRISFKFSGSWSVLGTTCKKVRDLTEPTMNFGWLTDASTDEELRRVVLHEFGHALGLTHEHMTPAGGIIWDKEKVIKDLSGPPNNWSKETINNNMFRTFEAGETNFTKLDSSSIMMYPIPAKWTKNGFSVGLNSELSEVDKKFIKEQYP